MKDEDAFDWIIHSLRNSDKSNYSSYGYDIYLPNLIDSYVRLQERVSIHHEVHFRVIDVSPHFFAAAWELCRRGILRPGVRIIDAQPTTEGSAGYGYSITPFGQAWIAESNQDNFVPTEPGRFASMLKPFSCRFGPGFYERAQEAIRCYGAHAYLACCAMCGAAAESILLSTAIAKSSEDQVHKAYTLAQGRSKVENILLGQATEPVKREFRSFTILLKYWRDEAAHGKASKINDNEAYTSLGLLLRFAIYVDQNWTELTGKST